MSTEESTNYCLRVIRVEDLHWQSSSLSRVPDLYVKAKLGDVERRTRVIKECLSPMWNESLLFPSSDTSGTLTLKVKHKSRWPRDPCIGLVEIKLADLLMKCSAGSGDATLCLSLSDNGSAGSTGRIILHLDVVDKRKGAEISLATTEEDLRRGKILRSAGASDVTQVISDRASQLTNQGDLYQAVGALMAKLDAFQKVMSALSEIHPFLTIAWKLASGLYAAVQNVFQTDQRVVNLVRNMDDAFAFVGDVQLLPDKAVNLQENIVGLLKQTIECCLFVSRYAKRWFLTRMVDFTSSQKIDEFEQSLANFKQKIESGVVLYTATIVSMRTPQNIGDLVLRQRLNPSLSEAFWRPSCLPNTRVSIRQTIVDWALSETKQNIFWLHGVAGSGKSTVSTTIQQHFRDMSRVGAFLFFERGKSDPSTVIRTIAYKLALFDSSIGENILLETKNDKDALSMLPSDQFTKLLLRPLSQASTEGPVLIVLDALDECGTPETRRPLMQLFRERFASLPKTFRFLITSRQETDIDDAFRPLITSAPKPDIDEVSSQSEVVREVALDYTSDESHRDVLAYFSVEMPRAVKKVPGDWKWEDVIATLGKSAGGLFIWASTTVKLVSNSTSPFRTLKNLVSNSRSITNYGLDTLYAAVLRNSGIGWAEEESRTCALQVLYLVLFAKVPVTCEMVDGILGFPPEESADLVLARLRCLLSYSPGVPVCLFHASLGDYLTSTKCSNEKWSINVNDAKRFVLDRCFSIMKAELHFNICNLETSFVRNDDIPDLANRVKSCIPSHLKYACIHWVEHLRDVPYSPDAAKTLSDFAFRDLLFWFEALSLVKSFGGLSSRVLLDASEWINFHAPDLGKFLRDASDLATTFSLPISRSAPHIYVTMIPLSKDESKVSSHYSKRMSSMVRVQRVGSKRLLKHMRVLKVHKRRQSHNRGTRSVSVLREFLDESDERDLDERDLDERFITSISVSRDGRLIASRGEDGLIRVWDFHSGEELVALKDRARSISLFPDGRRLGSLSSDGTWRIWNIQSGDLVLGPRRGEAATIESLAVSPDGRRVALGQGNGEVELFDMLEERVSARFPGNNGVVRFVAFTADGKLLASLSQCTDLEYSARIWDVKSGEPAFGPFQLFDYVTDFSFSPDGKYIMYIELGNVNIVEVESERASASQLKAFSISSVCFSTCGTRIAVCSQSGSVSVLDARTGDVISGPFDGYTHDVTSVAFTPDGRHVISGSYDGTIGIWDTSVEPIYQDTFSDTFVRHDVDHLVISDDGSRIASASYRADTVVWDKEIVIWDAKTGDVIAGPLHNAFFGSHMAFSRDNSRLVATSNEIDETIRVWDVESGQLVFDPIKCPGWVDCIAISPDGTSLATGSADGTLAVWGMGHGPPVAKPLEIELTWGPWGKYISALEFSPNGSRLASGPWDGSIKIFDTATWEVVSCVSMVSPIRFSPDSTQVVSVIREDVVTTWNTERGDIVYGPYCAGDRAPSLLFTQNGPGHPMVSSIRFSTDSTQVASVSREGVVTAWDTERGDIVYGPYCAGERAPSLLFTENGLHLLSRTGRDIEIHRLDDRDAHRICDPFRSPETPSVPTSAMLLCSRDGSRVVSCFDGITIRVWDTSRILSGQRRREGKCANWELGDDGWIVGGDNGRDLAFWLPYGLRQKFSVLDYPNVAILSHNYSTILDFTDTTVGDRWTECFTPSTPSP